MKLLRLHIKCSAPIFFMFFSCAAVEVGVETGLTQFNGERPFQKLNERVLKVDNPMGTTSGIYAGIATQSARIRSSLRLGYHRSYAEAEATTATGGKLKTTNENSIVSIGFTNFITLIPIMSLDLGLHGGLRYSDIITYESEFYEKRFLDKSRPFHSRFELGTSIWIQKVFSIGAHLVLGLGDSDDDSFLVTAMYSSL